MFDLPLPWVASWPWLELRSPGKVWHMSHRVQTQKERGRDEGRDGRKYKSFAVPGCCCADLVGFCRGTNQHKNQQFMANACPWVVAATVQGTKQLPWPFAPAPTTDFTLNRHPQEHDKLFVWVLQVFAKMSCHLFAFSIYFFIPFGCPQNRRHLSLPAPLVACPCCRHLLPCPTTLLGSVCPCLQFLTIPYAAILSPSCPPVCIFHFGTHILLSSKVDRGFENSLSMLPLTIHSILTPPPPFLEFSAKHDSSGTVIL